MKKIEPTIFKTQAWKDLVKEAKKAPKFIVTPINRTKEDIKRAKLMQKFLDYQYKHNINGFQEKYILIQKKLAEMYCNEVLYGIKVRWDTIEKMIKTLA